MDLLSNLRLSLDLPLEEVASGAQLTVDNLNLIESGYANPTDSLLCFYSKKLRIDKHLLETLIMGTKKNVPGFEPIRLTVIKAINGYLKFTTRMSKVDEEEQKISNQSKPFL